MPFRDDPRIADLETLAARISRMHHAVIALVQSQQGNLTKEDAETIRVYTAAYQDYLDWLKAQRSTH